MMIEIIEQRIGYKHTALGWIPEDWEVKKLESISDVTQGISKGRNFIEKKPISIPYLRVANVLDGRFDLQEIKEIELLKEDYERYLIKADDILLTEGGDPDKLGRGGIWKNQLQGLVFQNHLFRIRSKRLIVLPDFLAYYIQGTRAKYYFLSCAKQTTGIASINSSQIKATPILLPPLPEQKAITDLLGTWDKAISTTTQLIAQKEQRKKWMMQKLLTGKKRLPGFSEEWRKYNYRDLLTEVKRPIVWNDNELYKLISVKRRSGGLFHRENLYGHQILTKNLRTAKAGDFLISKMQIVHGASGLTTKEFDGMKISGSYIAVRAQDPAVMDMDFFNWFSKTPLFYHQTYISSFGVHIEKMTFDVETFLDVEIKLPSVQEQAAIANILQTADKEIQLLKLKLEKQKEQKKGLMQVLLTGKVRLVVKPDHGSKML